MALEIIKQINSQFPDLKGQLIIAGINISEEDFIKKTLKSALTLWIMFMFILGLIFSKDIFLFVLIIFLSPLLYVVLFVYFMQYPSVIKLRREREINRELVFAGRFLLVELESGVPLYDALKNIIPSYKHIGPYIREIITKVDLGTSLEDAINEAVVNSPSSNMRRILWQILNSLKTGSDIRESLNSVLDQIVHDQVIEVKQYAQKLNPLAMFYMMMAIILPTLGMTMFAVLVSFLSIEIKLSVLLLFSAFLGFIQFMFLNIIRSQRPAIDF
jgi:archaeal flagellar protein FlaJ